MGWIAVPRASVAPPLACIDSMRPIPANRFQLIPQAGSEAVTICSALRYADSAIVGIPSAPGEFMMTNRRGCRHGGGRDVEALRLLLDGDDLGAQWVSRGGGDYGHRGDCGISQHRLRSCGADCPGEHQGGDHGHGECRCAAYADSPMLHRGNGTARTGAARYAYSTVLGMRAFWALAKPRKPRRFPVIISFPRAMPAAVVGHRDERGEGSHRADQVVAMLTR